MSLAICIFLTCCVIIVLSLIPKKLSELEMFFLFFSDTVFELSIFTIVTINLDWIIVGGGTEIAFANLTLRLFMIPLALLISSNVLLYDWKILKWVVAAGMVLLFIPMEALLERLGVLVTPHWNVYYTVATFGGSVAFSRLMAQFIINARQKEEKFT